MKQKKDKYYKKKSHLIADSIASAIIQGDKKLLKIKTEIKKLVTQINIDKLLDRNRKERNDRNNQNK